jgi:hypothetical protein
VNLKSAELNLKSFKNLRRSMRIANNILACCNHDVPLGNRFKARYGFELPSALSLFPTPPACPPAGWFPLCSRYLSHDVIMDLDDWSELSDLTSSDEENSTAYKPGTRARTTRTTEYTIKNILRPPRTVQYTAKSLYGWSSDLSPLAPTYKMFIRVLRTDNRQFNRLGSGVPARCAYIRLHVLPGLRLYSCWFDHRRRMDREQTVRTH